MNKNRRKALEKIHEKLEGLMLEIEELQQDEQEYADNMPENLQNSERHELAESAAYALDEAKDSIQSCMDSIENAIE